MLKETKESFIPYVGKIIDIKIIISIMEYLSFIIDIISDTLINIHPIIHKTIDNL